jgi:hypothetical protein
MFEILWQPNSFRAIKEYSPALKICKLANLSPVLQLIPLRILEVSFTLLSAQNDVGPSGLINGTSGFGYTLTFIIWETASQPNSFFAWAKYSPL